MVYPASHVLLSFGGPLGTSVESWSCSLRSTPTFTAGGNPTEEMDILDDVMTTLTTWWATAPVGQRAFLGWAKFNLIGPDGRYANPWSNTLELPTPLAAPASSAAHPFQVACAVTLETGRSRGLASKGRLFLPGSPYGVGSDGRIGTAEAQTTASKVADLLTALNATPGYGLTQICSNVGNGAQWPVTQVSCGRVLDTIRTRRAQNPEERGTPVAVAAGG